MFKLERHGFFAVQVLNFRVLAAFEAKEGLDKRSTFSLHLTSELPNPACNLGMY